MEKEQWIQYTLNILNRLDIKWVKLVYTFAQALDK